MIFLSRLCAGGLVGLAAAMALAGNSQAPIYVAAAIIAAIGALLGTGGLDALTRGRGSRGMSRFLRLWPFLAAAGVYWAAWF